MLSNTVVPPVESALESLTAFFYTLFKTIGFQREYHLMADGAMP